MVCLFAFLLWFFLPLNFDSYLTSVFRASQDNVSQDHPGLPVPPDQRAFWFVRLLHFLCKVLMIPILLAKYITRILLAKHRSREKRRGSFRKNRGPLFSLKGPVQSWFQRRNLLNFFMTGNNL